MSPGCERRHASTAAGSACRTAGDATPRPVGCRRQEAARFEFQRRCTTEADVEEAARFAEEAFAKAAQIESRRRYREQRHEALKALLSRGGEGEGSEDGVGSLAEEVEAHLVQRATVRVGARARTGGEGSSSCGDRAILRVDPEVRARARDGERERGSRER
eukprot:882428-Prymnesium_polylepis.1